MELPNITLTLEKKLNSYPVMHRIFYMNIQVHGENSGIQFENKFTLPQFR